MTRAATKQAMKADAKKADLQTRLVNGLKISASESEKIATGLINKYGDKADDLAYNCLMRPYDVNKALGNNGKCSSKSMVDYFNKEKRNAKIVNTALSPNSAINKTSTQTKGNSNTAKPTNKNQKQTNGSSNTSRTTSNTALKDSLKAQSNQSNSTINKAKTKASFKKDREDADQRINDARKNKTNKQAEAARKAAEAKKSAEAKREALKQANINSWNSAQWQPQPISANGAKKTTTPKTTQKTVAQNTPKPKLEKYDWAANQQPAWKPKPISEIAAASPKKTTQRTATAKSNSTTANNTPKRTTTNTTTKSDIGNYDWKGNQQQAWKPRKIGAGLDALTTEEKLAKAKGDKGYITFDDLKQNGIDVENRDFQTIVNRQKTLAGKAKIITSITPGEKSQNLANWMTKNTDGKANGKCLGGVQIGMDAGVYRKLKEKSPIAGSNKEWLEYKHAKSNSACDAHHLLDSSGDWFTVEVPNKAYHNPMGNAEMRAFNNQLKSGTIGSVENRAIEGSKGAKANKKPEFENNTPSAIHGHIWVKGKNGENLCDGIQSENGIDFSRYGRDMYVTLSSDSKLPDDLALETIKASEKRREQYSMLLENVYKENRSN